MFKPLIRLGAALTLALVVLTEAAPASPLPMIFSVALAANANAESPASPAPVGPAATAPSRGELLYTTHCISCHTTQMHWRDKRVANNWISLKKQVRRWQDATSLAWSESDITEVSRYLNDSIYHFEQTVDPVSMLKRAPHQSPSGP
jgi:mono/diheme cytochrome c family protein